MKLTIQANVVCTIQDPSGLIREALDDVRERHPLDHWTMPMPGSAARALETLIREAIAVRLLRCENVSLHEIGTCVQGYA